MNKRAILLCIVCITSALANAQVEKPNFVPPSPKSREFEKYINYNVSMYNGIADVSIPLYTIKLKGLDIPVNLSYHGSGIKFGSDNGDVGVGWVLNPGFRVSRTIYGFADEKSAKPSYIFDSLAYYSAGLAKDKFLSHFVDNASSDRPTSFNNELIDGQYDIFNFSLPTESGSFIITDRTNKVVAPIEKSNVKINYTTGTSAIDVYNGILGFNIVDQSGIKYFMGEALPTSDWVFETTNGEGSVGYVATSWALTDVVTPLNDSIHFKYEEGIDGGWKYYLKNFSISEAVQCMQGFEYGPSSYSSSDGQGNDYNTFFLKEIITPYEKILITRNISQMITAVEIFSPSNILQKKIEFTYTQHDYQTTLESVKINDRSNTTVETYSLEYYLADVLEDGYAVPDQWGFYKSSSSYLNLFHEQFGSEMIYYKEAGSTPNNAPTLESVSQWIGDRILKDSITVTPEYFSLKKIIYPTGGYTEYEYESNRYLDVAGIKIGGGLRIKRISSHDAVAGGTLIRDYTYGENENGYGLGYNNQMSLSYKNFISESLAFVYDPSSGLNLYPQRYLNFSSNIQGDIDPGGFISTYVSYPCVTEYYGVSGVGGKNIYKYDLRNQFSVNSFLPSLSNYLDCNNRFAFLNYTPLYVSNYRYWDKPVLTSKETFSFANSVFTKTHSEKYEYEQDFVEYSGLKVFPFASDAAYDYLDSRYYNYVGSFFKYGEFKIQCGINLLKTKRDTLYTSSGVSGRTTSYNYNSLNQVIEEITKNSKGDDEKTTYRYPKDILSGSPGTPAAQNNPISYMIANNMIGAPIETYQSVIKSGTEKVVSAKATTYKGIEIGISPNSYYTSVPATVYQLKLTDPILKSSYTGFTTAVSSGSEVNSLYSGLESKLLYETYNNYGNVTQYSQPGNVKMSYIWGYKGKYLMAEVSNSVQLDIAFTSFEADDNGDWTIGNTSRLSGDGITGNRHYQLSNGAVSKTGVTVSAKYILSYWSKNGSYSISGASGSTITGSVLNGWTYYEHHLTASATTVSISGTGLIDELRFYPENAQMSTFTYEPLVGVTSTCDANSKLTYYEYDDFNRLLRVRDKDKNILKQYEYKYKYQP